MRRTAIWQKMSGHLSARTERDYERAVIPYLRIFWPTLQQTPARGEWDRRGVDLMTSADDSPLTCIVQCKGFHVHELGDEQIRPTVQSIEAFAKSGITCHTYLIVHNRDGRWREFNKTIDAALKQLVADGIVERAELWDRQKLLDNAFDGIIALVDRKLRVHSRQLLDDFQELFQYGRYYLPEVPVEEDRLLFKRDHPCSIETVSGAHSCNIGQLLQESAATRWTLLTGRFGAGKSTVALHFANTSGRSVILAQCATLPMSGLGTGANLLLETILSSLDLLDAFEEEDQETLYELAGPALGTILRQPDTPYMLVLDGLDENRGFANRIGMQTLTNQLSGMECPVLMTTRLEHLNAMFGEFTVVFDQLSFMYARQRRYARLLRLLPWQTDHVVELLGRILEDADGDERTRLSDLSKLISSGEYVSLYGDLPLSPLFLQFILEDVAEHGIRPADRVLLLLSWVKRKIRRDRRVVERPSPDDHIDTEEFVDRMLRLMENVAHAATYEDGEARGLSQFTDASVVRSEAGKMFTVSPDPLLAILLHSVLLPQGSWRGSRLRITFAFKALHEFFLACYLVRENVPDEGYPDTVKSFYTEIRDHLQSASDTTFVDHFAT